MAELKPYRGGYYLWKYLPRSQQPSSSWCFSPLPQHFTFGSSTEQKLGSASHFLSADSVRILGHLIESNFADWVSHEVEVIGYAARVAAHNSTDSVIVFAIQNVFLLLGPTLFAASVYMTLARIICSVHAEKHSLVRIKWLTKIFVMGDVVSFLVQGGASGLMATGNNQKMGSNIVVAGLVIQVIMFGLFIVTSIVFEVRMRRSPPAEAFDEGINWMRHLRTLYAVSALILVRSIFRVVEYAAGNDGYPLTHEWMLYVFDSVLMIISMLIWGIWHPGTLPRLTVSDQETVTEVAADLELKQS
ncbi:RTA-like protein [Penicillium expansum]|nr:RTA-like protein [Penicillium expansum]